MARIHIHERETPEGRKLKLLLQQAKITKAKAGILQKDFQQPKAEDDGTTSKTQTLGDVAVDNEFGTPTIPARPFVRGAEIKQRTKWFTKATKWLHDLVTGKRQNVKETVGLIGLMMESDIRDQIRSNVPPPNAPSTIAKKTGMLTGKRKRKAEISGALGVGTLRDTGQMLNAVSSEVTEGR